jgi:hypothetical protein
MAPKANDGDRAAMARQVLAVTTSFREVHAVRVPLSLDGALWVELRGLEPLTF